MLGSNGYKGVYYYKEAQKRGYRYFYSQSYDKYANQYGVELVKSANGKWLQNIVNNDAQIWFCSNPLTAPLSSSLHMEYTTLCSMYESMYGSYSLEKVGTLWKLTHP